MCDGSGCTNEKSTERTGELAPRAGRVEAGEHVEIARRMHPHMRDAAREQVDGASERTLRTPRTAGDHREYSRVARRDADDARGLAVVERVEDEGIGLDEAHSSKLQRRDERRVRGDLAKRDERRVRGDLAKRDERRVRGDLAKSDVHGARRSSPRSSHVALRQIAPHPSRIALHQIAAHPSRIAPVSTSRCEPR